ncbi:MAG: 23S rRNA (adenine(2503)-C(2))-methyltransferase RlmN, partial [Mailhella sp.]|nr:23S rRNA (adenine(2503)-C(2))-methyltransferase RlmN [Mailhella sp.]
MDDRINLLDLPYPSLEALVAERFGWAKYRAQQIWQWIWARNVRDIDSMTDIAREAREVLKKETRITLPKLVLQRESSDGTVKFLLRLEDGECIETVLIPSEGKDGKKRLSQCLSSQVGCAMACTFCSTGKLGFKRNMTM